MVQAGTGADESTTYFSCFNDDVNVNIPRFVLSVLYNGILGDVDRTSIHDPWDGSGNGHVILGIRDTSKPTIITSYDRGHYAPNGDFTINQDYMRSTFLTINRAPLLILIEELGGVLKLNYVTCLQMLQLPIAL